MGFLGIYRALYAYVPQSDQELSIEEGDLLYVIEKSSEDDWWKAKKRATGEGEEEPVGLIPSNYIEEAEPQHHARALYDYTRQTDEEVSFTEDAELTVYDTSDPDWTLVGFNGEYGFAPANYISITDAPASPASPKVAVARAQVYNTTPDEPPTPSSQSSHPQSPAAAIAGIIQRKSSSSAPNADAEDSPKSAPIKSSSRRPTYTPDASDDEGTTQPAPVLPSRPKSDQYTSAAASQNPEDPPPRSPGSPGIVASPPYNRATHKSIHSVEDGPNLPGGFHLYSINEMVSVMGKQKKMPTTLGINIATGTILVAPAKPQDAPQQEWTADKLTHYSIEGKHVFIELVRPSRSIDFHAGAKDTAQEIVSALGEVAGAFRAEGLREVLEAGTGGKSFKTGQVLYDFMAQGDDEVTVAVGDDVVILDSTKSEEWWQVRRVKNGKEGVVPSSYVEVTGVTSVEPSSRSGVNAGRSITEQNRLEEVRLARDSAESGRRKGGNDSKGPEVGPGVKLPQRGSSLMAKDSGNSTAKQRSKRDSRSTDTRSSAPSKHKPDASKTRTWTDRSGSFKVEAEFLGCRDGKIHLHKLNGVKIAVPVVKMSVEDLEYVERVTGMSLDEDKPLSDIRRQHSKPSGGDGGRTATSTIGAGLEILKKEEYDWFDFFLKCGVDVHLCQRYATNFSKDSMDESVLPDITPGVLRTLGLKEGDILRVMKYLDTKYGRTGPKAKRNVSFGGTEVMGNGDGEEDDQKTGSNGGLFSGPGGALRNNTRKGRPAPTVQTSDVIDPKAFESKHGIDTPKTASSSDVAGASQQSTPAPRQNSGSGFDDDAWDVKPSKQQPMPQSQVTSLSSAPPAAQMGPVQVETLTGTLKDLSLLAPALQPTIVHSTGQQQTPQVPQPQPIQKPGATPSFFSNIPQQQNGAQIQQNTVPQAGTISSTPSVSTNAGQQQANAQFQQIGAPPNSLPMLSSQPTNFPQQFQQPQQSLPQRQRPQPPQMTQSQTSLMPPPPPRPLSAPQNFSQPSGFSIPPLQQQLTGYQNQSSFGPQIAPPGQSLHDLRLQPTYGFVPGGSQLVPQSTGFMPYGNGVVSQATGFGQPFQQMQPQQTGMSRQAFSGSQNAPGMFVSPSQQQPTGNFQSIMSQPTGFQPTYMPTLQQQQQQQQTSSINNLLPPALQPQPTGQASAFGQNFGSGRFGQPTPPVPPIPQQPTLAPLQPQKTGPPPPVRFGVTGEAKKLAPQPTGRRANLSQATPQNPFGF